MQVKALVFHAKADVNISWHKSDYENMSSFHSTARTIVVGNAPKAPFACTAAPCSPSQFDLSPWQTFLLSDDADPMPLQYSLASLDDFFTAAYFPDDKDIEAKRDNFFKYLSEDYCGDVTGCAPPNPRGYWTRQPDAPVGVVAAAGVAAAGSFWSLGGLDAALGKATPVVSEFTSSNDESIGWRSAPPMPTARHNLTAVGNADGIVFALGGQDSHGRVVAAVEALDTRTGLWSQPDLLLIRA